MLFSCSRIDGPLTSLLLLNTHIPLQGKENITFFTNSCFPSPAMLSGQILMKDRQMQWPHSQAVITHTHFCYLITCVHVFEAPCDRPVMMRSSVLLAPTSFHSNYFQSVSACRPTYAGYFTVKSVRLSVCPSACVSVCLSVCLCVCVSVSVCHICFKHIFSSCLRSPWCLRFSRETVTCQLSYQANDDVRVWLHFSSTGLRGLLYSLIGLNRFMSTSFNMN